MLTFNGILGKTYRCILIILYISQSEITGPISPRLFKKCIFFFTYGHQLVNDIQKYWSMGYANIMFPSLKKLEFCFTIVTEILDRCSSFDLQTERLIMYILENIAYRIPAISSTSTETYQGKERSAKNAVDEDPDTYALTKSETNPQLTVTLADIFKIGHIYISLTIGISHKILTTLQYSNSFGKLLFQIKCDFFYFLRMSQICNIQRSNSTMC